MIQLFIWIFSNRFCCGWFAGIITVYSTMVINNFILTLLITPIFYIGFRYFAHRYLK